MGLFDNIDPEKVFEMPKQQEFKPIPDKTLAVGTVEELKILPPDNNNNEDYVRIIVNIDDERYKNRKVNHNLKINSPTNTDKEKAIKAKALDSFNRYDTLSGGKIRKADSENKKWWENESFMSRCLGGTRGTFLIRVYKTEGINRQTGEKETFTGNYIETVFPLNYVTDSKKEEVNDFDDEMDNIPF